MTPECDIFGRRRDLNPGLILNRMHSTPELHPLFLFKQTGVTYQTNETIYIRLVEYVLEPIDRCFFPSAFTRTLDLLSLKICCSRQ